jgi:hypothetical protein
MLGQRPFLPLLVSTLLGSSLIAQASHGGTIRGQVEDPTTSVIQGATVQIADGEFRRETKTGDRGEFSFSGLPGGEYRVLITAPGFYAKAVTTPLAEGEMWNLRRIQLQAADSSLSDYPPTARLLSTETNTGSLVAHLMSGARVDLRCPKRASCRTQVASADGDVRFDGLPEGKYEMKVSAKGFYGFTLPVEVTPGVEFDFPGIALERCAEPTCDPQKRAMRAGLE